MAFSRLNVDRNKRILENISSNIKMGKSLTWTLLWSMIDLSFSGLHNQTAYDLISE